MSFAVYEIGEWASEIQYYYQQTKHHFCCFDNKSLDKQAL